MRGVRAAWLVVMLVAPIGASAQTDDADSPSGGRTDRALLRELLDRIDALESEVRELRSQVEELRFGLESAQQRRRALYLDTDRRLRALEGGSVAAPGVPMAEGDALAGDAPRPPAETQGGPAGPGADADAPSAVTIYQRAFEALEQRRFVAAEAGFERVLTEFPESAYADNAQYWLGESSYAQGNYAQALERFRTLAEEFPESAKVPDAKLKIGYSLLALGRDAEGRSELQALIDAQPNSSVARLAQRRLEARP